MKRIKELDGLRALAIFAVFLVHFHPLHDQTFDFTSLGWAGVDLFFALSGFLITGILIRLREEECPLKTFYWRRMLRIFPLYYVALGAVVFLSLLHGETLSRREILEAITFISSLKRGLSVSLVLSRLSLHTSFAVSPAFVDYYHFHLFRYGLRVFWSLSVEELFYILWAPVILRGAARTVLMFSVAPLFLCPILRGFLHTSGFYEVFNFMCRFDSLAAGGCVALLFAAVNSGRLPARLLQRGLLLTIPVSAIALLFLSWRCWMFNGVEPRSAAAFGVFGYSLLAILFAAATGACAQWSGSVWTVALRWKPLVYLGTISYSMYLLHHPIYVAVGIVMARKEWTTPILWLQAAIAVLCTIGVAALSWKYFESPILQFRDRPFFTRRPFMVPAESSAGD